MKNSIITLFVALTIFSAGCDSSDSGSESSCANEMYDICWDAPVAAPTGFVPTPGRYSVERAGNVSVYPLQTYGFGVYFDRATATSYVSITMDGYRYDDAIVVRDGAFAFSHGGNMDGTFCPTDGYIISASFNTPTTAKGVFQYVPACGGGIFSAFAANHIN